MTDRERKIKGAAPGASGDGPHEARLQALFAAAAPTSEPSDALQRRVAEMAQQRAPAGQRGVTGRRWTPWRIGLGLAAAMALAFLGVGLAPMWVAAQVLRRAEAAAGEVRNAHWVIWRVEPDGSRTKINEEWEQGGRSHAWELGGERIRLIADGKLWTYEPKLSKVTVQRQRNASAHGRSIQTLKAMVHEYAGHGWSDQIHLLGDAVVNGRRVRQVEIQRGDRPERGLLRVDAATDLPIEGEAQTEVDGRWATQMLMEVRYDEPLPAGLFQPSFPKSARLVDLDRGQQEWRQRLARGIARKRAGDRTIVIRDIQVNAEGDLFLLYTAGKGVDHSVKTGNNVAGGDWNVEAKDDLGTVYEWQTGNFAFNNGLPPRIPPRGYLFNGERLEGDWWIPVIPQTPWKPRRFTLTFRFNPVQRHGAGSDPAREARFAQTAAFTLPVTGPDAALIPDYMPYMGTHYSEEEIRTSRARARAWYYGHEQPDLPRALAYYQEIIHLHHEEERATGMIWRDYGAWIGLGTVLQKMGRKEEARAAFQEAVREADYPDFARKEAKAALAALDADSK